MSLLWQSKAFLFRLLVAPLVILTILLLLLSHGLHGYPVAACSEDDGFDMPMVGHTNVSQTLLDSLDKRAFTVTVSKTPAEARALYEAGKAKALILFPSELTQEVMIRLDDPAYVIQNRVRIEIAADNPIARLLVLSTIAGGASKALADTGQGLSLDSLPLPVDVQGVLDGFARSQAYVITGFPGYIASLLTGIFALLAVSAARKKGLGALDRPMRESAGFILAFAAAGWLLYLGLAWVFSINLGVSLPARFLGGSLVLALLTCASAGIALTLTVMPGRKGPNLTIPWLILPLFFGGWLWPVEIFPRWFQWFPWLLPGFHGLNATLGAEMGKATGLVPWQIAITGLLAILFMAAGAWSLAAATANARRNQS
jgi:ABC-2 type transport system permease protein